MRKLVVNTFVSLDGVMQAPGGPEEDPVRGFAHGGWSVGYWDEEMMRRMAEADPYELLLGRGTLRTARSPTISTAPASMSPRRRSSRWSGTTPR